MQQRPDRRPTVWLGVLITALLAACAAPAARELTPHVAPAEAARPATVAPAAPLEALRVGFANVAVAHAPLYVALESGAFVRQGLDVELINVGAATASQAALVAGDVLVAGLGGSSTITAMLAGADLTIVASLFDTAPYQVLSTPDITAIADLRGKTIGINRFGGSADFVVRYLLRQAGVDPEREVVLLQVGAQPERVAALRNGAIQATLVDPPFQILADRESLRIIADTAELDLAYPHDVLAVNREWLRTRRDQARRVLQAVVDGARLFKSDRELGMRALQRWLKLDDPALLADTYAYFTRFTRAMPDRLLPSEEGLQLVIEEVAAQRPEARALRPADLVDSSLVAEIR
ncbi:MAG TPA: ABC transporter substrate-binding protein [Chloroflexota bacterium]|nr:ABC transporter substrate-binding protein [Chloroflexota bacterium]